MADLEDFLRKAAERRMQRQQGGGASRPVAPSPNPQSNQPPPLRQDLAPYEEILEPEILEPEIIEPVVIAKPVRPAPPPQQRISDTPTTASTRNRPSNVSAGVDQADEKMASHVKSSLDHQIGKIDKRKKPGKLAKKSESVTNEITMVNRGQANIVGEDLLSMLRQPQTLKTAFIASEIFKRKFE